MVYLILAKVILPQEGVPFLILLQLFYTMGNRGEGKGLFHAFFVIAPGKAQAGGRSQGLSASLLQSGKDVPQQGLGLLLRFRGKMDPQPLSV